MRVDISIAATLLAVTASVSGQSVDGDGCLRLLGSVACPGFSFAYINPSNLSNAFPFFKGVTDVNSFDVGALNYFSDIHQFKTTKFINQLSCYNASAAVIRWERTVLCSQWVNERWSVQCLSKYNSSAAATSQKMVCQDTCQQYSANEKQIVNSSYCPGPDESGGNRTYQLTKDFTDCTNWTTLATNDSNSCVSGRQNENNCGFGTSTVQLCNFCAGSNPDSCCYDNSNTDMSVCGYALPSQSTTANGGASTGGSSSGTSEKSGGGGLSGGQIAGIVVGSVIGGLLILALLLWFLLRKKRNSRGSVSTFGHQGALGGLFGTHPRNSQAPQNNSEKGLLGTSMLAASSPTVGGPETSPNGGKMNGSPGANGSSTGSGGDSHMAEAAAAGAGLGIAGATFSGGPGERNSGVVLPRVRDENQNGDKWSETGMDVNVLWPYQASLPDELDLRPGMRLRVLRLYDDAWGTAQVIHSLEGEGSEIGKQGAFPIVCVSEGSSIGSSMSHRAGSSLDSHSH